LSTIIFFTLVEMSDMIIIFWFVAAKINYLG